jgi:hypothetical protein
MDEDPLGAGEPRRQGLEDPDSGLRFPNSREGGGKVRVRAPVHRSGAKRITPGDESFDRLRLRGTRRLVHDEESRVRSGLQAREDRPQPPVGRKCVSGDFPTHRLPGGIRRPFDEAPVAMLGQDTRLCCQVQPIRRPEAIRRPQMGRLRTARSKWSMQRSTKPSSSSGRNQGTPPGGICPGLRGPTHARMLPRISPGRSPIPPPSGSSSRIVGAVEARRPSTTARSASTRRVRCWRRSKCPSWEKRQSWPLAPTTAQTPSTRAVPIPDCSRGRAR